MVVRAQTTAPACKYTFTSPTVSANSANIIPIYLSRNRVRFYGAGLGSTSYRSRLYYSEDAGANWTSIRDFQGTYSGCKIDTMVELASGEVIVSLTQAAASVPAGRMYKSSGWVSDPTTATWTNKSGSLLKQGLIIDYTLNDYCVGTNGVVLAGESGPQTDSLATMDLTQVSPGSGYTTATITAPLSGGSGEVITPYISGGKIARVAVIDGGSGHSGGPFSFNIVGDGTGADWTYKTTGGAVKGAQTNKARRLIYSSDFGETWSIIYDIYTTPSLKYRVGCHLHAAAYDEQWDRIWLLMGDNTGEGPDISGYPTKTQVLYSDDRGTTWNALDASSYIEGASIEGQYTSIKVTRYAIIIGIDALRKPFGFLVIPRTGYRTTGNMYFGGGCDTPNNAVTNMQYSAYSADKSKPSFLVFHISTLTAIPCVLISYDYGFTTYEFWREDDLVTRPLVTSGAIIRMFGPDVNNKLLGYYNGYDSYLTGTLTTNF